MVSSLTGKAQSLVMKFDRCKFYVKKWSEIFTEFELRHEFLNKNLQLEREKLLSSATSAGELICSVEHNSAVQAGQVVL